MTEIVPSTGPEPVLVQIGDIVVSQHWVVTPSGTAPLAGSQWLVRDASWRTTRIPPYAIVLAVVFGLACLLGLLFLLIKEDVVVGSLEVTVRAEGLVHLTQLPAGSPLAAAAYEQVRYVQELAAAA